MRFEDIDFNNLYMQQKKKSTFKMKNVKEWDSKASSMNERIHKSIYNNEFLESINFEGCDSILDVGCGVGNLSLKFASKVKEVTAMDYSSKMLEYLIDNSVEKNITNIHTVNLSWYDSWDSLSNSDIVVASRSMEVANMKEALEKLDSKANKRVYLTYKVGGSFLDDKILKAMKREIIKKPDYIYVLNILYSMGINASVKFIKSEGRNSMYNSLESFIKSVAWSIGELSNEEENRLKEYYKTISNKDESNQYVTWALISWEK